MNAENIKNLKVAIVGGGYGGLSAAIALHRLGAQVDVYEQAREIREVGAGIGLRPSSMDMFRQWGVFDEIAAVTSPSDYFEILTATGDRIMLDTWPGMDDYDVKTHTHLVHRNDFIRALLGVLPEGMVHVGHKLETITDHGDRATLTLPTAPRSTPIWSSGQTASSRQCVSSCSAISSPSSLVNTPTASSLTPMMLTAS